MCFPKCPIALYLIYMHFILFLKYLHHVGLRKKLQSAAKSRQCSQLESWINPVCNHLYWCAAMAEGNEDCLVDMWTSIDVEWGLLMQPPDRLFLPVCLQACKGTSSISMTAMGVCILGAYTMLLKGRTGSHQVSTCRCHGLIKQLQRRKKNLLHWMLFAYSQA